MSTCVFTGVKEISETKDRNLKLSPISLHKRKVRKLLLLYSFRTNEHGVRWLFWTKKMKVCKRLRVCALLSVWWPDVMSICTERQSSHSPCVCVRVCVSVGGGHHPVGSSCPFSSPASQITGSEPVAAQTPQTHWWVGPRLGVH